MKIGKKLTAIFLAATFALSFPLAACDPKEGPPAGETDEYAVKLEYNDEVSRPRIVYVAKGESMSAPAEPLREGYQLDKWTDAEENGNPVSFPYTPAKDVTLYATWKAAVYDVTFDFNFGNAPDPYVVPVEYDKTVEAPDESILPDNEGFRFRNWTLDKEGETAAEFPYTVRRAITFYAHWVDEGLAEYTYTFDWNFPDAPTVEPKTVTQGDRIKRTDTPQTAPARPGYKFLGWATEKEATDAELVKFPYTPQGDVTFYAVWEKETYIVRFYYNYTDNSGALPTNGIYHREDVEGGDSVEEPAPLTRTQDGYTFEFDGWYTAAVGGEKIEEFPYTPTKSVALYAHWLAPMTTTTIFDAEFTPFDPLELFPGYSGSALGVNTISPEIPSAHSEPYPILGGIKPQQNAHTGMCVTYLFKFGATLTFRIYSSAAVTGVTLKAALSTEFQQQITFMPEGDFGYSFIVNGTALDYGSVTVDGGPNMTGDVYKGSQFTEYTIATNVSLNEGWNEIKLVTNNRNAAFAGGTTQAIAPVVDYITLETSSTLSWRPEYDNIYRNA